MVRIFCALLVVTLLIGCAGKPDTTATSTVEAPSPTAPVVAELPTGTVAPTLTAVLPMTGESTPTDEPISTLPEIQEYPVPAGSHPHDVRAADGRSGRPGGGSWALTNRTKGPRSAGSASA
jgi:streptogramin lyase